MTDLLADLFFPYFSEKQKEVQDNRTRFVHYTSATTGLSIISKKQVWMRNCRVMNDFQEIQHGQRCVHYAWQKTDLGDRLKAALTAIDTRLVDEVAVRYDSTVKDQALETYLISVSEHGGGAMNEDRYGRLSMWRAYGGSTNVALVLKSAAFFKDSSSLNAFVSPVLYGDEEHFASKFRQVVENVESNIERLRTYDVGEIASRLSNAMFFAALSSKHPGFSEEREWRILYSPTLFQSENIGFDIEAPEGVPQKVYKLPLNKETMLTDLLEGVIIGPTEHPNTIREAYLEVLTREGFHHPDQIVKISNIPLRK